MIQWGCSAVYNFSIKCFCDHLYFCHGGMKRRKIMDEATSQSIKGSKSSAKRHDKRLPHECDSDKVVLEHLHPCVHRFGTLTLQYYCCWCSSCSYNWAKWGILQRIVPLSWCDSLLVMDVVRCPFSKREEQTGLLCKPHGGARHVLAFGVVRQTGYVNVVVMDLFFHKQK